MPPRDKGKAIATPSSPKKRKRSPGSESPGKRSREPEEQTLIDGPLESLSSPYLLADRLKKVHKLRNEKPFYARFEEEKFGKLGQGAYGTVSKFRERNTDKIYAVKIVNKDAVWKEVPHHMYKMSMYVEAACFTEILPVHKNIIKIAHICESPKYIYYVMERLSKFDLRGCFRGFTSAQARTCFYRVLQALDHLHQHGIIHGDIKLENVCMREGDKTNPILIDFGLCNYNKTMVRKRKESFIEGDVFTPREIDRMLSRKVFTELLRLVDLLEMLLTGEPWIIDRKSPTGAHYPPKLGTDPDAVALLEFMRDREKLKDTTCEQLLQHCWFDPERSIDRPGPPG